MSHTASLHDLGSIEAIPRGEGRVYQVDNERIAVFRTRSGEVYATEAECPHRGGPLADGLIGDGCVVCPLHAYVFDLATGLPRAGDCRGLRTYGVSIDGRGRVWLERGC